MNRVKALGTAIRDRRRLVGISQTELGTRAGLHRTFISRVERGASNLAIDALFAIADALDVQATDLLSVAQARATRPKR